MKFNGLGLSVLFLILFLVPATCVMAQNAMQPFVLPDARVGEPYRVEIEALLREKYGLRLESGARTSIIQWAFAGGDLPVGLTVRTDGFIVGTPTDYVRKARNIRLRVTDAAARSDELILDFIVEVKPAALRLVQIGGPRLVPIHTASEVESGPTAALLSAANSATTSTGNSTRADDKPKGSSVSTSKSSSSQADGLTSAKPMDRSTMRAIVGIEQSGVSSGNSAQNPFLNFFFSAGLSRKQVVAWGDVRLTTTPQQISAFVSAASNTAGAVKDAKINDLATSFNFKFGPEYLINPDSNIVTSLIAGFGAASTLTAPAQSGQIFKLPNPASSQFTNFINQYPEAKTPGAAFIAFVPLERDRFFRQYFMGLRIRSYHDKKEFPSMLDLTFGQNSAVTGGQLRHFVFGVDGSHRMSFMNNAFYIFGSAQLKIGGPKSASVPFILDPAETTIKLSDPNVVITSRQFNRDYYRLGFGVDLLNLFNPDKDKNKNSDNTEKKP